MAGHKNGWSMQEPFLRNCGLQVRMPALSRAITPQQEFVMYNGDVCLGSAPVFYSGPTLAEMKQDMQSSVDYGQRARFAE